MIYLGFFLPMAATRTVLLKSGILARCRHRSSLIVTTAGVVGALVMWWVVRDSPLWFLFVRPERFRLVAGAAGACSPRNSLPEPDSAARLTGARYGDEIPAWQ